MQISTLQELDLGEVDQVSGSGLSSFVGNAIIEGVKLSNDFLNTGFISSFGKVFNVIGLKYIHQLADTIGYSVFRDLATIGRTLGGDDSRIHYHYDTEWT